MSPDIMSKFFWNWWSIPYWLSFIISLILTILLVTKKREGNVRLFIVIVGLITVNTLAMSLAANSLDPDFWLVMIAMTVITGPLAVSGIFHYAYIFLKQSTIFEHKKVLIVYVVPLILITLILVRPEILWPNVVEVPDRSNYGIYGSTEPPIAYLWSYYNLYQGLILGLVAITFFRAYRTVDLKGRVQAAYYVLACIIPAFALTITSFLEYIGITSKIELSGVTSGIAIAIISIGILKAQLFDIEVIVSKSVKYMVMNIIFAWIFVISRELFTPLISTVLFSESQVAMLIAGFIMVTVFVPIKNVASNFTDKLLPKKSGALDAYSENFEIYYNQLELAWEDNRVTEKERRMLSTLRSALKISEDEHQQMEREVLGTHKSSKTKK